MSAVKRILDGIRDRGLRLVVRPDGKPYLAGPGAKEKATPALLAAVKLFLPELRPEAREEAVPEPEAPAEPLPVIDTVTGAVVCRPDVPCPSPTVELLWPTGQVAPRWDPVGWDAGACWWRIRGSRAWHRIAGRDGERPKSGNHGAALVFAEDEE